ncbi:MAG: LytR C-terminal domain-containing protein [Acidimicrobiia bacterium]|nr:LytR C-terminal domain-containing protein [Acidimicrobiia bacterium]
MPGQHLAPGRGRFFWELTRYLIAWAAVVGALVGVFWLISNLLPAWLETTDTTEAVSTTVAAAPESTTTTVVEVTTTTTSTTTTPTTTTTTLPPVQPVEETWVLVLNSTGRSGLAGGATGLLGDAGYLTLIPDNYPTTLEVTRILHAEGLGLEAAQLAASFFPEAEVLLDTEGLTAADPDLVVILGLDYEP